MSIQTQIERLRTNVNNALLAISEKDVQVPENSTSDDLSNLILQIDNYVPESITIEKIREICSSV